MMKSNLLSVYASFLILYSIFYFEGYMENNSRDEGPEHLELPLFDLDTLLDATNNFSSDNKLGEGGFGPVYKVRIYSIFLLKVTYNLITLN